MKLNFNPLFIIVSFALLCSFNACKREPYRQLKTGAEQLESYLSLMDDKNVAIVANPTSLVASVHLVDTLLSLGVDVKVIFGPEHGFRGTGDAGEKIENNVDTKTGLPIVSLYGKNKKPQASDLNKIEVLLFDIQDVGVRFYTYIATLQYVMEACAENDIQCIVLDRPNPNGFYVDGPVLDTALRSFLGLNPIPLVHGMTIGEMALMINSEGWLGNDLRCDLHIVQCKNYDHTLRYVLPVKPSPNLPTMASVYLYPSLGLFEGTVISAGRGTGNPFEVFGHPELRNTNYTYTPVSIPGASKYPKFQDEECNGFYLGSKQAQKILENPEIELTWLIHAYQDLDEQGISFFNATFDKHAGNSILQDQIKKGLSEEQIKQTWEKDLLHYKKTRKKYLLYKDFE